MPSVGWAPVVKPATGLLAVAVAAAVLLSGCTGSPSPLVRGSAVSVAVSDPLTSLNAQTSYGRQSPTNAAVAALTGTGFGYTDDAYREVDDTSFGTATLVKRDPLTVTYRISPDARWSDGARVTPADLLLAWAANSGALNTPKFDVTPYVDAATGRIAKPFPDGTVWFDGAIGAGLEHVTHTPVIDADEHSITLRFDAFVPDWRTLLAPGLPAHVVARQALGLPASASAASADKRLVEAVQDDDVDLLARIARTWDTAYDLAATPADRALLVSAGPYRVRGITAHAVTLEANPRYRGSRAPSVQRIVLRVIPDPLEQAKALQTGTVDIVSPTPTASVLKTLLDVPGVTVTPGSEAVFEHLDLQIAGSRNGTFADERVRRAFLDVVPRQAIVEQLVAPVEQDAGTLDSFVLRPGSDGYDAAIATNGSKEHRTMHPDAARALLAQAGTPNPRVCVLYDPANPRRVAEFQLIRTSAAKAGFQVTDCSSSDWTDLLGVPGSYDAALFAWDTTRLGPTAVGAVYRTGSQLANFSGYSDPKSDALIDELHGTDDPARQDELLTRLDTRLWAAAYGLPLFAYPTVTAVDDTVTGVTRSPLRAGVFWNAWAWKPASASPEPTRTG
jgi:peptide/nickel transport system substrate-binding protein